MQQDLEGYKRLGIQFSLFNVFQQTEFFSYIKKNKL